MLQYKFPVFWYILGIILLIANSAYTQPELILPLAHTGYLKTIDVHPNKDILLSASEDGTVKLWDIPSGLQRQTFRGHEGKVYAACFSEDGQFIVSGGQDNTIRLWQEGADESIRVFIGHQSPILSVAIDKMNKWVLSSSMNGVIKLWDLNTAKCIHTYTGHKNTTNVVKFSKNGNFFISGGGAPIGTQDNNLRIWDTAVGKIVETLEGHEDSINDISISENEEYIATASDDGTVRVWERKTGLQKYAFQEKTIITSVRFLPDNNLLMTASIDGYIRFWNIKKGIIERKYKTHDGSVNDVALSSNGDYLFSAGDDHLIKMWDASSGELNRIFKGQQKPVYAIAYSNDGHYLATGNINDNVPIKLWNMRTGSHLRTFGKNKEGIGVNRLKFSEDNQWLISTHINMGVIGNYIQIWEVKTGKLIYEINGIESVINDFELTKDKKLLAYCTSSGIQVCEIGNVLNSQNIPSQQGDFMSINWSSDNKGIFVGATDGTLKLLSLKDEAAIDFKGHQSRVMATELFPDKKAILAGGGSINDSELILWNVAKKQILRKYQSPHLSFINCIAFSPDGKLAVTGSHDGMVCLWDINEVKPIAVFDAHTDYLTAVSFSPDGQHFTTSSGDNTIKIWDVGQRVPICTLFSLEETEWGIVSTEGYYFCSQELARKIGFRLGKTFYPFEQFDIKYNRPDIVLSKMGYSSLKNIEISKSAYLKRLKKLNFTEDMLSNDAYVPEIKIENTDLPISTTKQELNFQVSATDNNVNLDRLNVWINDVPIYGINGINLRDKNVQTWLQDLTLSLSDGENKIQVSVLNQGGAESLKETIYITYNAPLRKPNLYLIAIGTEKFVDANYNLKYPLKDLRQTINLFQSNSENYEKIIVDTLFNTSISEEQLQKVKKTLHESHVDDQVILFVAGHGVLDDSLNYYLATPEMDFLNPSNGGVPYEQLENLLDGIPARKKLFLMDACHSGEIDKEEIQLIEVEIEEQDSIIFRSFNNDIQPKYIGLNNSFELMKQLFVDLRRGTGATVISSAGGVEFAWEGDRWNNSVFGYCLLSGLKEKKADSNKDGEIMVSELQQFLAKEVARITKNRQQPTMRLENTSNDWRVW